MEKRFKKLSRAQRYNVQILGKITLENNDGQGDSYICNTLNVSLSGALVETGSIIPFGALLKYSFCMPGFTIPVNVIGEVVRGEREADPESKRRQAEGAGKVQRIYRYGIIFLDMKEADKRSMEAYLMNWKTGPRMPDNDRPEKN
ncbi:MAG: PilZ domain-containing protein [Deltaproteobacteria bacterium]|nr:PilZ domain-containing protein [Deltaproteobacteria bacterium]